MILADKIIELRKKNGWSQEELAEKLDVSRQAVSKWESAQSVPDINRVLMLSELFGVSTDYLLKDELDEPRRSDSPLPEEAGKELRKVSLAEARDYLLYRRKNAERISLGVLLCVLSPIFLILLIGGRETGVLALNSWEVGLYRLSEAQAAAVGVIPMILLIVGAVVLFVSSGLAGKRFEYLHEECFETEYGVTGFVREQRERGQGAFIVRLVTGVALCVLSIVPVFIAILMPEGKLTYNDVFIAQRNIPDMRWDGAVTGEPSDFRYLIAVAVLLCMVAVGVWLIVRASIVRGGYTVLLQEGDYSGENKQLQKKNGPITSVYWGVVTAGYLAYSFITMRWDRSWIVWPVAGVLYGVLIAALNSMRKE